MSTLRTSRRALCAFILTMAIGLLLAACDAAATPTAGPAPVPTGLPAPLPSAAAARLAETPTVEPLPTPAVSPTPGPGPLPIPPAHTWAELFALAAAGSLAVAGTFLVDGLVWLHDQWLQPPLDAGQQRLLSWLMPGGLVALGYLGLWLLGALAFTPDTAIEAILAVGFAIGGTKVVYDNRPSTRAKDAAARQLARDRAILTRLDPK